MGLVLLGTVGCHCGVLVPFSCRTGLRLQSWPWCWGDVTPGEEVAQNQTPPKNPTQQEDIAGECG